MKSETNILLTKKYFEIFPALGEARLWRFTLPLSPAGEREEVRGQKVIHI
jgi:hypothetical protein